MREQIDKALQLFEQGDFDGANKIFRKIASQETGEDPELLMQLGRLAEELGEDVYAISCFGKARELQPENAVIYSLLASIFYKSDRSGSAEEMCNKAIELNSELFGPYFTLGQIEIDRHCHSRAVELFKKALDINPDYAEGYLQIILSLRSMDQHEEALTYAKKLLHDYPVVRSYIAISRIVKEMGRMEEATSYLEKALKLDDKNGAVYLQLSGIKKFSIESSEDSAFIQKAEKALTKSIPSMDRSLIHFCLGKVHNDRKEWEKAFEHYSQANLLDRDAVEPTVLQERFNAAKKLYTKKRLNQEDLYGSDSKVPVFIVGMPRSGTTLTEQVIASHPEGAGAGELTQMLSRHAMIYSTGESTKKALADKLSKGRLVEYADEYLQALCDSREGAKRIIDKMPDNFLILGLIHLLFPNARIIHAMRNPLDTCLSCYFQPFAGIRESYDFKWLAARYRTYRKAMDYWKKVLPEGVILDAHYEDLVMDFENQSKRILDFCGLSWDDQCLEFNKNSQVITTASVWQARQPIYKSSRKRWVNYAPHLEVLANGISEYLDDEDIAELEQRGVKVRKKWNLGFFK